MKSSLEVIRELRKASNQYPAVLPFLGAVLELDERITRLEQPQATPQEPVTEQDISRANLTKMFQTSLLSAGTDRDNLTRLHRALKSVQ